jgi:hypothetical protein
MGYSGYSTLPAKNRFIRNLLRLDFAELDLITNTGREANFVLVAASIIWKGVTMGVLVITPACPCAPLSLTSETQLLRQKAPKRSSKLRKMMMMPEKMSAAPA